MITLLTFKVKIYCIVIPNIGLYGKFHSCLFGKKSGGSLPSDETVDPNYIPNFTPNYASLHCLFLGCPRPDGKEGRLKKNQFCNFIYPLRVNITLILETENKL